MSLDPNNVVKNNEEQQNSATEYLERLAASVGNNRDSKGLGNMNLGPFTVGSVDAINGEDAKEVPECVATTHELKRLARFWAEQRIERDFY